VNGHDGGAATPRHGLTCLRRTRDVKAFIAARIPLTYVSCMRCTFATASPTCARILTTGSAAYVINYLFGQEVCALSVLWGSEKRGRRKKKERGKWKKGKAEP